MWNETVSLYIDDSSLRLMVTQGQHIKKSASLKLEPGLVKGSIVIQEAEVAARIRQLLKSQKVNTRKIILGFSALHSLTRPATLPQLPKSMLAEAVAREARRVLPVPLDQLYLSWRPIPCPKGRTQVFMVAVPRKAVDSLMKTLREAGLTPYRMNIKPLALTGVAPVNTCVFVDVQPAEFDIIVMVNEIAQPIRTITFPVEEISWEQKINMITSDLDRTLKFFDTNNPEKPLAPDVPIYVSGELTGKPDLHKQLSTNMQRPVVELSPRLKGLAPIDTAPYMVNIALSFKAPAFGRKADSPLANLNLLPAPYQPKPMSINRIVAIPGTTAIIGLVVPMLMLMQSSSSNIKALQSEIYATNQIINQKTAQRQELKNTVAGLEKQLTDIKSTSDKFQKTLSYLDNSQQTVQGDLIAALNRASMNISLDSIAESEGNLTISGSAPQESDILNYAREMDITGRFTATTVASMTIVPPKDENSEKRVKFTLKLQRKG
jgi:type IV pilus assembly protein PilM